jgi:Lysophospholipase L1 and related esterases
VFNILCFGDSNTYGWDPEHLSRYPLEIRWPGALQRELGSGYRVIEEGCGGRTAVMDDGLETFVSGMKYLEPCMRSHCPLDRVIVMLGTNDLKRRYGLSAADIANGVTKLCDAVAAILRFEQDGPPIITLVSPIRLGPRLVESKDWYEIFDFDAGIARSRELPDLFRRAAEARGWGFLDAGSIAEPSPLDSVHMTAEGHAALAGALARMIREEDGSAKRAPRRAAPQTKY